MTIKESSQHHHLVPVRRNPKVKRFTDVLCFSISISISRLLVITNNKSFDFAENKKNSDSEQKVEDVIDAEETTKSEDVRKRRTRRAD